MGSYTRISRKDFVNTKPKKENDVLIDTRDDIFYNQTIFAFENNAIANTFFIDTLNNKEWCDLALSKDIEYDEEYSKLQISNNNIVGEFYTFFIETEKDIRTEINDFFLIVDADIPVGADITYFIVTDKNEIFPIKPHSDMPMRIYDFDSIPSKFKLKAVLKANNKHESPKIKAFAIMYFDQNIDDKLGLLNPDLSLPNSNDRLLEDEIYLYRGGDEDNLLMVESTNDRIELIYNDDNELIDIETYDKETSRKLDTTTLHYGEYVNSENEAERVLLKISSKKHYIRK